jgi:histone acetyltransferase 1
LPVDLEISRSFTAVNKITFVVFSTKTAPNMTDPEDWAVDANEALEITLLGPLGTRPRTFHPTFTYPIFGDAETIYGYKGLSLNLSFAAWDFRAFLKVRWDEKIDNPLEIEAEKVEEPLLNYLPEGDSSSFS